MMIIKGNIFRHPPYKGLLTTRSHQKSSEMDHHTKDNVLTVLRVGKGNNRTNLTLLLLFLSVYCSCSLSSRSLDKGSLVKPEHRLFCVFCQRSSDTG